MQPVPDTLGRNFLLLVCICTSPTKQQPATSAAAAGRIPLSAANTTPSVAGRLPTIHQSACPPALPAMLLAGMAGSVQTGYLQFTHNTAAHSVSMQPEASHLSQIQSKTQATLNTKSKDCSREQMSAPPLNNGCVTAGPAESHGPEQ